MYKTEYLCTWKIDNFSFCSEGNREYFFSEEAEFESLKDFRCLFTLYPRGSEKQFADFISCDISLIGSPDLQFDFYVLEVIGASGNTLKKYECNRPVTAQRTLVSGDCVPIKEVVQDAESSAEDSLTFCLKLYQKNSNGNVSHKRLVYAVIGVDRHFFTLKVKPATRNFMNIKLNKSFEISISEKLGTLEVKVLNQDSEKNACFVDLTLSMPKLNSPQKYSYKAKHLFTSSSHPEWKFPSSTLSTELQSNRSDYINRDFFHNFIAFYCEFSYSNDINLRINTPETLSSDLMNATAPLDTEKKKKKKKKKKNDLI